MSGPNPGSPEATKQGCTCPILDNARGLGYMGGAKDRDGNIMFVMREDCPLHGGTLHEIEEKMRGPHK